jgi:hypothetical protein
MSAFAEQLSFMKPLRYPMDNVDFDRVKGLRTLMTNRGLAYEYSSHDPVDYFGWYDVGFTARSDENWALEAADYIGEVVDLLQPRLDEDADIDAIQRRDELSPTGKKQLIDARRGQGRFRAGVFKRWRGCAVTGCTVPEVLRASHIKP